MSAPADWTRPGTYPVAPGVHRIPLPLPNDGLRATNVYVLDTDDGPVLIDGGWALPAAEEEMAAGLRRLGRTPADIRRFLVTHIHRDHYTQAVAVRQRYGTPIGLGRGEEPTMRKLSSPGHLPMVGHLERLAALGGAALAAQIRQQLGDRVTPGRYWEQPDEWLDEGDIALPGGRVLSAVATPGHTAGHIVFHDVGAGLLFAGDHVLPTITPSIGFEVAPTANPLGAFLDSLATVRSRPDARLLPAHGPVTESAHARVDELVAHHGQRLDEIERVLLAGVDSPMEVAAALRWTRRGRAFAELDPYNQMLAVFETVAHVNLLRAQGRIADGAVPTHGTRSQGE